MTNTEKIANAKKRIDELERLTFLDTSKNCLGSNNIKIKINFVRVFFDSLMRRE